ncbi:MAG TPA: dioxygenase [Cytophagales bacterium]|nr:dioxygenase [Cytophagales bacterium]HAP64323.1 dioxygenase [Cytophagales bacterium]
MKRDEFVKSILALTAMSTLGSLQAFSDTLPRQGKRMPVLFTSHGNPMDIPLTKEERPFWNRLYQLGRELEQSYELKAVLVVSAHWCTRGTFVNVATHQEQIYDYYGFPDHFYDPKYQAVGAPEIAHQVKEIVPSVTETEEWGLDHGAWPMLMHLFPNAEVPVFQLSIDYYAQPRYHYELGQQLKSLREKGVLIIGSGSLVHNLPLAMKKLRSGDASPFGWEPEYEAWAKQQIEVRNFEALINYETSHKLGKLAAPTPDHYVPVLYSLGLSDHKDEVSFFYESEAKMAAFSEQSFIIHN